MTATLCCHHQASDITLHNLHCVAGLLHSLTYHGVALLSIQVLFILMVEFIKNSGYHWQRGSV